MTRGIAFILLAVLSFTGMNLLVKSLSGLHPMQIIFFRAVGSVMPLIPIMLWQKVSIIGHHPKWLLLRSVVGLISLGTFFFAVQRIPLGSAISIRYLGPIFGAFLGTLFLKEVVKLPQWFCFAVAFTGVLLIKGFDLRVDMVSFVASLISATTAGMVFVLVRYLATREHPLTIINYFMMTSVTVSLGFLPWWRSVTSEMVLPLVCVAITGFLGQLLMTMAFRSEETNTLAPFKYIELVFALIFGFILFGESYEWTSILGMAMIILGMILNLVVKRRAKAKVAPK